MYKMDLYFVDVFVHIYTIVIFCSSEYKTALTDKQENL